MRSSQFLKILFFGFWSQVVGMVFGSSLLAATILVPSQYADLQSAIKYANDGDTIELAAGTYASPSLGFRFENNSKTLTIKAASGATVEFNGGGKGGNNLLWFGYETSFTGSHAPVTFEGITFLNGYSSSDGVGAGVTLLNGASATFSNCTFKGNLNEAPSTGGGALLIGEKATAFCINCTFENNYAKNEGGAISIKSSSSIYIYNSIFTANRTNLPGHRATSAGGAIHVGDSKVRIGNTRFQSNEAGYVGGAIFAIGTYAENWTGSGTAPGADVIVTNSTFIDNHVQRDGGNTYYQPTEAGAFHAEDFTKAYIYSSRFVKNYAMDGGAVNLYRAQVEVHDSTFLGNYALGAEVEGEKSLGGTFSVLSNDALDLTTGYGSYNRPSGALVVTNSYVQGRYDTVTTAADVGGCLYASGDSNRLYGENSIPQDGTIVSNQATVTIDNVVFNDCDVVTNALAGSGVGGAVAADLVDLTIQNSFILNSDASGVNSAGGGIAVFNQSDANLSVVTLAKNSALGFGGGLFAQGSDIQVINSHFLKNEFSPSVSEDSSVSYGAAIFAAPYDGNGGTRSGVPMTGMVSDSIFSANIGLTIWDDDRTNGPVNSIVYNNNTIYASTFGSAAYTSKVDVPPGGIPNEDLTVAELNTLVVTRDIGISTDKSTVDNQASVSDLTIAKLLAVPDQVYTTNAAGDVAGPTLSYLAYVWNGTGATLDTSVLSNDIGVLSTSVAGAHSLSVTGTQSVQVSNSIILATAPSATLSASPNLISGGENSTLSWIFNTSVVDAGIDNGISINPSLGSITISPLVNTVYDMLVYTTAGSAYAQEQVNISSGLLPILNITVDNILLSVGSSTNINYSASANSNVYFSGTIQPLTSAVVSAAPGNTTEYTISAQNGFGSTDKNVTIHVNNGQWPIAAPGILQPSANEYLTTTTGLVTLGWNSVATAGGYYLELWEASTGQTVHCEEVGPFDNDSTIGKPHCPNMVKNTTLATSSTVTLAQGDYVFAVRACDKTVANFERCGLYATQSFTVAGAMSSPSISQPFDTQTISVRGVTFGWTTVASANGYGLEITNRASGTTVFSGSLIGETSNYTLISLPNGEYTFKVRACTAGGFDTTNCSLYSSVNFNISLVTPTEGPSIIAPVAGTNLTQSTQTFSWTAVAKADNAQALYYEVVVDDLSKGTTALQISVSDPSTSTIATLPSSAQYRMKVRACQSECGNWSTPVDFSMTLNPVPMTAPTITNTSLSNELLTVEWTPISGADLYQIQVIQPTGGPGGSALTVAAKQVTATSTVLSVPVGVANVIVQACTGDGCGPYSPAISINPNTINPAVPNLGTPLAGSYVDGPVVNFTWSRLPDDNGSNTIYRLYVQDLSRQSAALDVYTTNNYYAAYFKAESARYDAIVIANPGPSQITGPAAGFNVRGSSADAPTMVQPAHQSILQEGNIQLGWTPIPGATLYEYFVAIPGEPNATVRGVTPGLIVQVPLSAVGGTNTVYSGIVRACPQGAICVSGSDFGWGPWSVNAGPGVTNFTVTQ